DFVAKFGFINKKIKRSRVQTWSFKTLNFTIYKRKRSVVIRYPHFDINHDEEKDGEQNSVKQIVLFNRQQYETKISTQLHEAMLDIVANDIPQDAWGILCAETELQ
ncbi:unnamed protein product, partial [Rotaria sordida]